MRLSKLLPGIILPFLMFAFLGSLCPGDEEDEKICSETRDAKYKVYRVNDGTLKKLEVKTPNARAECSAFFKVEFGWEDDTKFQSDAVISPMDETFAGLKLKFGETSYSNTYIVQSIGKLSGELNPDSERGYVWVIEIPVSAPSTSGDTQFYVQIEHDVLDTEFNFWVDVAIEYSYVL